MPQELEFFGTSGGTPLSVEATYLLDVASTSALTALTNDLRSKFPGAGITLLDQNGMPGI
jgi:hypothetical protein